MTDAINARMKDKSLYRSGMNKKELFEAAFDEFPFALGISDSPVKKSRIIKSDYSAISFMMIRIPLKIVFPL